MISDSVLLGLNVTNHVSARCNNLIRSALNLSAEETGSSIMIKRLVLSANKRMQCCQQINVCKNFSFMIIRKKQWSKYRALWNASKYLRSVRFDTMKLSITRCLLINITKYCF